LEGPLLPILHAINDQLGYVDVRAVPIVADVLNLSRAEVHGVVTFYHDFHRAPPGRHVVKVCRAEACQAMGADRLYAELERACGGDGRVTVEPVYCLGNCALSPAALVDGRLHGRLDTAGVLALVRS
jgi:formate dehydrogenase subunit gamma